MTESTTALKEATSVMTETRRRYQALEIELQSALSLVRTFVLVYIISATQTFIVSPVVTVSDLSLYQNALSIRSNLYHSLEANRALIFLQCPALKLHTFIPDNCKVLYSSGIVCCLKE